MARKLVFLILGLGLVLNLLGDISAYELNRASVGTSAWVARTYQVLGDIGRARQQILVSQLKRSLSPKLPSTLESLRAMLGDPSTQEPMVRDLMNLSRTELLRIHGNRALAILAQIEGVERQLLHRRQSQDQHVSSKTSRLGILANTLDIVLILLATMLFVYDRKTNAKMQKALASALAHVESVNENLRNKMLRKEKVFKTAVHNLKNPLGSIRGFATLLKSESGSDRSALETIEIIQKISNGTLELVGSILETETQEGERSVDHFQMLECIRETCFFLMPAAKKKAQHIMIDESSRDFAFTGPRAQIRDVFYNVIGNALKFSPPDTTVIVDCNSVRGFNFIRVRDQGPGFTDEDFTKLFWPGAKLSAKPSSGESSNGIGLYSVKQTLDQLRGKIEISNNKGGGACVEIFFPASPHIIAESRHRLSDLT